MAGLIKFNLRLDELNVNYVLHFRNNYSQDYIHGHNLISCWLPNFSLYWSCRFILWMLTREDNYLNCEMCNVSLVDSFEYSYFTDHHGSAHLTSLEWHVFESVAETQKNAPKKYRILLRLL